MTRNIIICGDGTNNTFGNENTNVVRLVQSLDRDPQKQVIYYDPGIGTLPEIGRGGAIRGRLSNIMQLAFGFGLVANVMEAYTFLMNYCEPDDRVYLFGFSRGAYSVRVLAGMLHMLGLLPQGNENLLPYVKRYYKSIRETTPETAKSHWKLCDEFRRTFARSTGQDRHFPIWFIGLWDTVSSVGWVWEPASFPFTARNPSAQNIWHAVSIDERRAFFRTNLMYRDEHNPSQVLEERWFAGDHSDIGGGHAGSEGGLWRCSFEWMINGANQAGLLIDRSRLRRVLGDAPTEPWAEPSHDLLRGLWRLAEFVPKRRFDVATKTTKYRCNQFRRRVVPDGSVIHRCALLRMRARRSASRRLTSARLLCRSCKDLTTSQTV